jgi:hypothetical protein
MRNFQHHEGTIRVRPDQPDPGEKHSISRDGTTGEKSPPRRAGFLVKPPREREIATLATGRPSSDTFGGSGIVIHPPR